MPPLAPVEEVEVGEDGLAVATDPVAADTWGATLLDFTPAELPYLAVAERLGLGTTDWQSVTTKV